MVFCIGVHIMFLGQPGTFCVGVVVPVFAVVHGAVEVLVEAVVFDELDATYVGIPFIYTMFEGVALPPLPLEPPLPLL